MTVEPVRQFGYAHRGFSVDGLENSMAAFEAAVALGYRHLETDARVTRDGVALAFHDDVLDRVTNHTGRLRELTWQQVGRARIMDREPIPLLEDVLSGLGRVHVNIDVKSNAAIGPTLDAIRRTGSWHRVRLAAFSHPRVQLLRQAAGPDVASSLSPPEVAALVTAQRVPNVPGLPKRPGLAAQVPVGLGAAHLVTPRFVETAHERGIEVHVWTINDRAEMVRLFDLGVDAVISDRADVLAEVLAERGHWPPPPAA